MTYDEIFMEGYLDALNEIDEEDGYEEAYLEGYYAALSEGKNSRINREKLGMKYPKGENPNITARCTMASKRRENRRGYIPGSAHHDFKNLSTVGLYHSGNSDGTGKYTPPYYYVDNGNTIKELQNGKIKVRKKY